MEYKILKYHAECVIPELNRKAINKPKVWESEGRIDTDYYHEDFGIFSDEDAENALAHAIGAIEDLSVNPNDIGSKDRLKTDVFNYFECVRSSKERRTAYQLLRVAADALDLRDIASIIQAHIERTEKNVLEDGPIDVDQALDFRASCMM